jgi:hypothetical protein
MSLFVIKSKYIVPIFLRRKIVKSTFDLPY